MIFTLNTTGNDAGARLGYAGRSLHDTRRTTLANNGLSAAAGPERPALPVHGVLFVSYFHCQLCITYL